MSTLDPTLRAAPDPRPSRPGFLWRRRRLLVEAGRYAVLVVFLLFALAPLLLILMSAVKPAAEVLSDPLGLPSSISFDAFSEAWEVARFGTYFENSVIYTITTVAGVAILSSLAGYALARIPFPGRPLVVAIVLVGLIVPLQSYIIPLYFLLLDLGLLGTYGAMILPSIALGLPFGVFLMRAFFLGLPEELAESARLDGCSAFGVFRYVMLPLARPALTTLAVVQTLITWNYFLLPLVVVPNEARRPVALGIMFFEAAHSTDRSLLAAGAVITVIPIVVVYLFLQRQFVRGVAAGAVRG